MSKIDTSKLQYLAWADVKIDADLLSTAQKPEDLAKLLSDEAQPYLCTLFAHPDAVPLSGNILMEIKLYQMEHKDE